MLHRIPKIDEMKCLLQENVNNSRILYLTSYIVNIGNNALFDYEAVRHSIVVAKLAKEIAKEMKLTDSELEDITCIGLLHDTGKQEISPELVKKPKSDMNMKEWNNIQQHSIASAVNANMVLRDPLFRKFDDKRREGIVDAIHFHHERYDGSGYPFGIKGKEIPLYSRIIAVVDVFDALTNQRPYRTWIYTKAEALKHLYHERRKHDYDVLIAFVETIKKKSGSII